MPQKQTIPLDRAMYKKIKSMDKEHMQEFINNLYSNAQEEVAEATAVIDMQALRSEIGAIRGIGESRLDEIMTVIRKHLNISE